MSDTVVKVEHLGKKYIIGHRSANSEFARFNEYLTGLGKAVLRRLRNPFKPYDVSLDLEDFWALRDVSFELKKGDRLGIIGHNGSGKSTLLKMLSRITVPTEGRITMTGRIASLLEVGTGFHPELTGRENIFLNGSILGMTRQEIKAKFDEIVDFSGVDKFLDTPVKRYSSGMYVRLAFAVAAHLNPEILVVDEVLSVGDADFQKKCIGKMQDISSDSGRTILFVSHNMGAVQSLCNKGIVLERGKMIYSGGISECVNHYFESRRANADIPLGECHRTQWSDGRLRFTGCTLQNAAGREVYSIEVGSKAVFETEFECTEELEGDILLNLYFYNSSNILLCALTTRNLGLNLHFRKGVHRVRFVLPHIPFYPDRFSVNLYAEQNGSEMDHIQDAFSFQTIPGPFHADGVISQPFKSVMAVDYSFETE